MNAIHFPPASPSAEYWWTHDVFGSSATNVWCVNSSGGVGPEPKAETVSAGGTLRYLRYA